MLFASVYNLDFDNCLSCVRTKMIKKFLDDQNCKQAESLGKL